MAEAQETATKPPALPVKLSLPLSYQQEIFHQVRKEDQLVILGRGLGLLRIVVNLLHSYDAAGGNLVILLGATEKEMNWIGDALLDHAVVSQSPNARGLRTVNTDTMTITARKKEYAKGGVLAITSRIMIVDLLTKELKPETITGIVVLHAERVISTSLEAFILRVYRQGNKVGFLKAFSDNPVPFAGRAPLATMMRNLYLRTPSLWPRFQVSVSESLQAKKAEVIELNIAMTDSMREIQACILRCIEACLSEIKKHNSKELDIEDWNVESALHQSFDVIIRAQLSPIWHRVSSTTKQLVGDLNELRKMLNYLVAYDSVTFWQHLETYLITQSTQSTQIITASGATRNQRALWLDLDAAQTFFKVAKNRAYLGVAPTAGSGSRGEIPQSLQPVLEEQPKWETLSEVLDEIERDIRLNPTPDDSYGTILIMCSDDDDNKTSRQLKEYLQSADKPILNTGNTADAGIEVGTAAKHMMRRRLKAYLEWKQSLSTNLHTTMAMESKVQAANHSEQNQNVSYRGNVPPNKRRRTRGGSTAPRQATPRDTISIGFTEDNPDLVENLRQQLSLDDDDSKIVEDIIAIDVNYSFDEYYQLYDFNDLVIVHPFSGDLDDRVLEETRPRHIIMYNPNPDFVRRVEVYRSSHNDRKVKVYFLYYGESVEEQRFLSAVRNEKDCFTKLIKDKGSMAVTLTTEAEALNQEDEFMRTINTRIAGGGKLAKLSEPPRVIVDMREFRSSLASLLHNRRMTVIPGMLTIGDYVLTPDICVERKSINDLISSLENGRLYHQCEQMLQYYKNPMVLIEFDINKSFSLEAHADFSSTTLRNDLHSKIVMLTIAFPQVRIIWSASAYETAEIFEELKQGKAEPNLVEALKYGLEDGEGPLNSNNLIPQEILKSIPGITPNNYRLIMKRCTNMIDLSLMSESELAGILGKEAGGKVFRFFNGGTA